MRIMQSKMLAALAMGCILAWNAGCSSTPPPTPPAKTPEPAQAMVDMQKVLEAHPARPKLRVMEQALSEAAAKSADKTAALEIARNEFEAAMKVRQNEDKAALEKKQTQLGDALNEQRRLFIEGLENEYRPLLFNLDLKLKTVKLTPEETQALQKERDRLEAEQKQKLTTKEAELKERFNAEMDGFASELSQQSEAYAKQWMTDRKNRIDQEPVSPDLEKQRQEIVELSGRMIQDSRTAVAKVAVAEKIEIVWVKQAVRQPLKDITDAVVREIANAK